MKVIAGSVRQVNTQSAGNTLRAAPKGRCGSNIHTSGCFRAFRRAGCRCSRHVRDACFAGGFGVDFKKRVRSINLPPLQLVGVGRPTQEQRDNWFGGRANVTEGPDGIDLGDFGEVLIHNLN